MAATRLEQKKARNQAERPPPVDTRPPHHTHARLCSLSCSTPRPALTPTHKQAASVGGPIAVGAALAGLAAPNVRGWYKTLAPNALQPPDWVFGPVWTALYASMGFAAWAAAAAGASKG